MRLPELPEPLRRVLSAPWRVLTLILVVQWLATLAFAEAAPDAEALVVLQRVLEALGLHVARGADALGVARRAALLREEGLGVRLGAQSVGLPGEGVLFDGVDVASDTRDPQVDRIDEPVVRDTGPVLRCRHLALPLVRSPDAGAYQ